jgi:hypothetical protein
MAKSLRERIAVHCCDFSIWVDNHVRDYTKRNILHIRYVTEIVSRICANSESTKPESALEAKDLGPPPEGANDKSYGATHAGKKTLFVDVSDLWH